LSHDERVPGLVRKRDTSFNIGHHQTQWNRLADFDHLALEALAIFRKLDRIEWGAQ